MRNQLALFILLSLCATSMLAQFTPVAVTGFNHDIVAEAGTSSLAVTSTQIDGPGVTASNSVLYTAGFAATNTISAGGLPNAGTFSSTTAGSYALAAYTGNNALIVPRSQSGTLSLQTPAAYTKIRLLAFSAEEKTVACLLNISLTFSDGTITPYLTNYTLSDWFGGMVNVVSQGMGRVKRVAAGPYTPEGITTNDPRFYFIEITLNCTDRSKLLQTVRINNVSAGTTSVYPNAVFMGLSGTAFSQTIAPVITASDCTGPTGVIALTVSGGSSYTYAWNTNPIQTTSTATGLAPGNYNCVITDAAGCTTTFNGTVSLNNNATISIAATPSVICNGGSTQLTVVPGTGTLTDYSWTPGTLSGTSITVSPTATTTYIVSGTNGLGCTAAAQFTVNVQAIPAAPMANPVAVCNGATATLTLSAPNPSLAYNWYNTATGGTALVTANSYSVTNVTAPATYFVEAVSSAGCTSASRTAVSITVNPIPGSALLADTAVCPVTDAILRVRNAIDPLLTYRWYSALSGGAPVATGYTFTIVGVSAPAVWYVEAVSTAGCVSTPRERMAVSLIAPLPAPVVAIDTISFSSLSFSWPAVAGATGYLVSTNAGTTYLPPSSGSNGTRHVISGLPGNTSVTLLVKATGPTVCQTSAASLPVSATTLSTREIFVPNVFTPNGDGKNDVLRVFGNYIRSIDFKIFNQWGQLIFSSTDASVGWDGKHKGQLQPVGVYTYTLKLVRQDGTSVIKKGAVNLIQ
ncbi:MAG: gliding motility-associated C-terminal domain-containing protein [Sphingomonadales bacterium]